MKSLISLTFLLDTFIEKAFKANQSLGLPPPQTIGTSRSTLGQAILSSVAIVIII